MWLLSRHVVPACMATGGGLGHPLRYAINYQKIAGLFHYFLNFRVRLHGYFDYRITGFTAV